MSLESLNRVNSRSDSAVQRSGAGASGVNAGASASAAGTETARPAAASGGDATNFENYSSALRALSDQQERLARALESRRKLVDALREVMSSGGLDSPEDAARAADGMLRRGAVA